MPKKYSFSLQKVFDFRKRVEEKRAVELSKERTNLQKRVDEYKKLEQKKEHAMVERDKNNENTQKIDLNLLKIRKDYIIQLNKELVSQEKKVQDADNKVKESHQKLVQASKEKKMLEKLSDKKYEEYKKEIRLLQFKNENDVAGRMALKNKRSKVVQ